MSKKVDPLWKIVRSLDKGCDASPSCLKCRLPRCKAVDSMIRYDLKVRIRRRVVMVLYLGSGITSGRIARRFGVSKDTVDRDIRACLPDSLKSQISESNSNMEVDNG